MNSPYIEHVVSGFAYLRNGTYVNFTRELEGNTTRAVFGGLFPFTEYYITVAACNDAGCNETSTHVLTDQTGMIIWM